MEHTEKSRLGNLKENERICLNCKFYDEFTGACCNGSSENVADFMNEDDCCGEFEKKERIYE